MTSDNDSFFVDANVLVYAALKDDPRNKAAKALLKAPRRQMKHTVGGEHEDAPTPIFGERRSDIARDRAELIEQLDGLRSTVDRDAFNAIVGSRPDSAGRVLEQAANALLIKPCLLTDVHCRARGLPDNSPVVCANP